MAVEVLCYLDDTLLDDEPLGLGDIELSVIRDQDLHGIGFEATTSTLEFISNGRDYLENIKNTLGLKATTIFRADIRCAPGDEFETAISGKVNYSNYKTKCGSFCSVSVPIESVGCEMILKNRFDQSVDLDAMVTFNKLTALVDYDDLALILDLPTRELDYETNGSVLATEPPFHIDILPSTRIGIVRPDYGNVIASNINQTELTGAELIGFWESSIISPNVLWDERLANFPDPVLITGRLKGVMQWRLPGQPGVNLGEAFLVVFRGELTPDQTLVDISGNLDPFFTGNILSTQIYHFTDSFQDVPFDVPYSYTWDPIDSGVDGIYAGIIYNSQGDSIDVLWDQATFFKAETVKAVPATKAAGYLIHETLSRVVESITDNCCRVKSSYYGRVDSQPFAFTQDGCGGLRYLTSGLKIRNALNAKFFANMRDLVAGLQAIDNIGTAIEADETRPGNYVYRIEDLDFFYQDVEMLRCTAIAVAQGQLDASKFYSQIKIGYKKWQTQTNFGTDEFNADRTFRTALTAIQNLLDQTSILVAGQYPIEVTREQQFADTSAADTTYDDDNFIICLKRIGGTYGYGYAYQGLVVEQGNIDSSSNIFSPASVYNIRISPYRNLMRWARSIFASYPNITDSDNRLYFTEGTGNYQAAGILSDAATNPCSLEKVVVAENQDLLQTVFKDITKITPLWRNETLTFDYPLSLADYQRIKLNPYGYISFQCGNGDFEKGWLTELKYKPFQGIANITIRKTWA